MAGRPSGYKADFAKVAKKICELGGIDTDVADALGVDISTLYRWRHKHKPFCEALKVGKAHTDDRVEASLLHRAIGYSHDEDDIRTVNGEIVITPTVKHYPPDTTAGIFWLKNRRPDLWREKREPEEGQGQELAEAISQLADKLPGA